jgi:phosphatidylglycerol---prolipoprotein diacylglyceryl transferase
MSGRQLYTLFMLLAALVFLLVRRLQARSCPIQSLSRGKRLALALAAFVGGSLGAKLPFVLSSSGGWLSEDAWLADGKTITTGLLGAYLAVEVTKSILDIRIKTGDAYALPLALALAVGRWGCFFNGCCYGTATNLPWAVDFGDGVPRHPTQVYESLFHLSMAGVLGLVIHYNLLVRQRLKLYLIAYGAYRFLSEWIRPEPTGLAGLTFYQWAALTLIAGLAVQWAVVCRTPKLKE